MALAEIWFRGRMIGHARPGRSHAEEAISAVHDWAQEVFGLVYADGRALTASRAACFDHLLMTFGLPPLGSPAKGSAYQSFAIDLVSTARGERIYIEPRVPKEFHPADDGIAMAEVRR